MTISKYEFTFIGSKDQFWQKLRDWLTITKEGRRFRITDNDRFTIQRGRAFCSNSGFRIVMKVHLSEIEPEKHKGELRGFTMGTHQIRALCFCCCMDPDPYKNMGTYSFDSEKLGWRDSLSISRTRKEGWGDMTALIDHLGIKDYKIRDLTKNSQNHGVVIQDN